MITCASTHRAVRRSGAPDLAEEQPRRQWPGHDDVACWRSLVFAFTVRRVSAPRARSWTLLTALSLSAGCLQVMGDVDLGDPPTGITQPLCDADAGSCGSCLPGAFRCSSELLEQCGPSGSEWALVDQCDTAGLCDPVEGSCRTKACEPQQHDCSETGDLVVCNAEQTGFTLVQRCESAATCNATRGQERCGAVICNAGDRRCSGAQLEACRSDRMGFAPTGMACASAALCREDVPGQASCAPRTCTAGQYVCEGRVLRLCNEDSAGWTVMDFCVTEALCRADQQLCIPPPCAIGQRRCTGSVLEICKTDQTGFEPIADCGDPALCDIRVMTCLTTPVPPPVTQPPVTPPVTPPPVTPPTVPAPPADVLSGPAYTFVDAPEVAALGLNLNNLSVPREWNQIDDAPWRNAAGVTLGPQLAISRDSARFRSRFDIPGVLFAATNVAPIGAAARLAEFDLSGQCTRDTADTYTDALYTGPRQNWINCGSTGARTAVIAAAPRTNPNFVIIVIVTTVADRDVDARQIIWESFEVTTQ